MPDRDIGGNGVSDVASIDDGRPVAHVPSDRILIADDTPDSVRLLHTMLTQAGYEHVHSTTDPREVMRMSTQLEPDIVLLDGQIPPAVGLPLIQELRASAGTAFLPIVVLSGNGAAKTRREALDAGASDFIAKPFDADEVLPRVRNLLQMRRLHTRLHDENATLEDRLKERTDALAASRMEVLERLAIQAEGQDDPTGEHTRRVGQLAGELAERLGLPAYQVDLIRRAAFVHDVGKIAIPDSILHKQGALNAAETAVMRAHTTIGASMLAGGENPLVVTAERIAASHHERWDGLGYPFRLKGDAIPIEGRITAVADFFDSLTHDRPYRLAVPPAFVLLDIERGAGTQFDPAVAAAVRQTPSAMNRPAVPNRA
jgi:uncharacterized domain HDIG